MPVRMSTEPIISRELLCEIGDARVQEAEALLDAGHYVGAVYLGGYAVECYLKAAICHRLRWTDLLETFKTHDLDGLIRHSGLEPELHENTATFENFQRIVGTWDILGKNSVRYRNPSEFDQSTAEFFLKCVNDPISGVVPWLRRVIS